jgi:Uma2 family endonuclease
VPVSVSFSSDVKVQIKSMESRFYCYPDVTVDSSNVRGDSLFAETPRIVFEVLSPQTERIDRAEKLANYQTISTLHAYVLVDQFHRFITVYLEPDPRGRTSSLKEPRPCSSRRSAAAAARTHLRAYPRGWTGGSYSEVAQNAVSRSNF